jgi:RNA recognition motif-containing protein
MINPETNKSKGYAFIEFTNYKEFQSALNNPEPIIFGKQKLVFNSAKNRYDSKIDNEEMSNINNNIQIYDKTNNNDFFIYNPISIRNKENLKIQISGNSNGSSNNSSTNSSLNSVLHADKNKIKQKEIEKEKEKENIQIFKNMKDNPINIQVKYALENMANSYGNNNNPYFMMSKLCNFYCGPFLDKNNFGNNKGIFF